MVLCSRRWPPLVLGAALYAMGHMAHPLAHPHDAAGPELPANLGSVHHWSHAPLGRFLVGVGNKKGTCPGRHRPLTTAEREASVRRRRAGG